ncbi:MAG TPA: type VI secretion system baseplate subunit TssG [Thermoanaerobaculia bacterium]
MKRALFDEGHRFGFFQAVRLLEAIYPDRTGPAEGMEPEREVVRFRTRVGFDFPASEVDEVRPGRDGEPVEMTVSVLGLAGVQGPLPPPFVEELLSHSTRGDDALRDFLDLFNHRLLSLYYRARKKHRPACSHQPPDEGRVARCLLALIGLGTPALRDRGAVPDRSLIRYAGLLTPHPRSMVGLERMLADHFGVPVEIVPFRGRWLDIEEEDRTRIGRSDPTWRPTRLAPRAGGGGNNNRLGQGAVLGSRFWDQTAAFEIRMGPLGIQQLLDFLPVGGAHRALLDLARFYVDDQYEIDVRLSCRADEVPELRLGGAGDVRLGWSARLGGERVPSVPRLGHTGGARLGWTTWLGKPEPASPTAPSVLLREVP